jgi:hypothetical protein
MLLHDGLGTSGDLSFPRKEQLAITAWGEGKPAIPAQTCNTEVCLGIRPGNLCLEHDDRRHFGVSLSRSTVEDYSNFTLGYFDGVTPKGEP